MKLTLHKYDPTTKRSTGEPLQIDWEGPNPYTLSPRDLVSRLPKGVDPHVTIWAPNSSNSLFDGNGWVDLNSIDPGSVGHLIMRGLLDVDFAMEKGFQKEIFEQMVLAVNGISHSISSSFMYQYQDFEQSSWDQQLAEANDLINNGTESAILSAIAQAEDRDVQELALTIISKAEERKAKLAEFAVLANTTRQQVRQLKEQFATDPRSGLSGLLELARELDSQARGSK